MREAIREFLARGSWSKAGYDRIRVRAGLAGAAFTRQ